MIIYRSSRHRDGDIRFSDRPLRIPKSWGYPVIQVVRTWLSESYGKGTQRRFVACLEKKGNEIWRFVAKIIHKSSINHPKIIQKMEDFPLPYVLPEGQQRAWATPVMPCHTHHGSWSTRWPRLGYWQRLRVSVFEQSRVVGQSSVPIVFQWAFDWSLLPYETPIVPHPSWFRGAV